jgi:hypothetical protein
MRMVVYAGALALCWSGITAAQESDFKPTNLSFYLGQGVDSNLRELPSQIVDESLPWDRTYFAGVGASWERFFPASVATALEPVSLDRATWGFEVVGVQHWGLQDVFELAGLVILRSPFSALGPYRARAGVGMGFSYTFGRPTYEDGPLTGDRSRRYPFQHYTAFEFEAGTGSGSSPWTIVFRIHHRSGLYGAIAPKNVGSNFVAFALRRRLGPMPP